MIWSLSLWFWNSEIVCFIVRNKEFFLLDHRRWGWFRGCWWGFCLELLWWRAGDIWWDIGAASGWPKSVNFWCLFSSCLFTHFSYNRCRDLSVDFNLPVFSNLDVISLLKLTTSVRIDYCMEFLILIRGIRVKCRNSSLLGSWI